MSIEQEDLAQIRGLLMKVIDAIDMVLSEDKKLVCPHDSSLNVSTMGTVSKFVCIHCGHYWEESVDVAETIRGIETAGK